MEDIYTYLQHIHCWNIYTVGIEGKRCKYCLCLHGQWHTTNSHKSNNILLEHYCSQHICVKHEWISMNQLGHDLNDLGSVTFQKGLPAVTECETIPCGRRPGSSHWLPSLTAHLANPNAHTTQPQTHTHMHTHWNYRWEHSRSVRAMKCWLCFSSHTGHLSSGRLNASPLLSFSLTLVPSWRPLWCSEWTECTVADRTIALCDCTKCHHCLSRQKIKMIPLICVLTVGQWPETGWLGLCLKSHDWKESQLWLMANYFDINGKCLIFFFLHRNKIEKCILHYSHAILVSSCP